MIPKQFCITLGLLAVPMGASADIFAREDFNYTNGALALNAGGVGWMTPWLNKEGSPTVANGKGVVNTANGQQGRRFISELQTPPTGGTKVVWIAFEAQQSTNITNETTSTGSYGGLGLYLGDTEQLLIGKSWPGDYQWKAGAGLGLVAPTVRVSTLALTKVIARITMVDAATDTLDVWLNPAHTSSVAALGAPQITRTDSDLSFDTLQVRCGKGDAAVTTETWTFDAIAAGDLLADVVAADSDNDGMLDAWELQYGLVVGVDDSAGDPDADGLSNLQEYLRSTNPTSPDTDGDGLRDGVETGTGIFVSATNTGTSPTLADSDGDELIDGQENGSGIFVSASNPGTDPNKADSDGDTHRDDFEILRGSNPNLATSVPASGDLTIIGKDDFNSYTDGSVSGLKGGTGFDFDNNTQNNSFIGHSGGSNAVWREIFGTSTISAGKLVTLNSGAIRSFNGPAIGGDPSTDEHAGAVNGDANRDAKVAYIRADLRRGADTSWSGISAFDFGAERAFAGVTGSRNPQSGNFEFSIGTPAEQVVYSGIAPQPGVDYTLVVKVDFVNSTLSLWVNPDLNAAETAPLISAPYNVTRWVTAFRLGSGGTNDATQWDHVVMGREWSALSAYPGVVPQGDTYLTWIGNFAVNGQTGFSQDPDHDGIGNGLEHLFGTNPSTASTGLHAVTSTTPGVFRFRHTRTNAQATDVAALYEWSTDLVNWQVSGQASGGVNATITNSVIEDRAAPAVDEVEVTVTVTAGTPGKIFSRVRASRN